MAPRHSQRRDGPGFGGQGAPDRGVQGAVLGGGPRSERALGGAARPPRRLDPEEQGLRREPPRVRRAAPGGAGEALQSAGGARRKQVRHRGPGGPGRRLGPRARGRLRQHVLGQGRALGGPGARGVGPVAVHDRLEQPQRGDGRGVLGAPVLERAEGARGPPRVLRGRRPALLRVARGPAPVEHGHCGGAGEGPPAVAAAGAGGPAAVGEAQGGGRAADPQPPGAVAAPGAGLRALRALAGPVHGDRHRGGGGGGQGCGGGSPGARRRGVRRRGVRQGLQFDAFALVETGAGGAAGALAPGRPVQLYERRVELWGGARACPSPPQPLPRYSGTMERLGLPHHVEPSPMPRLRAARRHPKARAPCIAEGKRLLTKTRISHSVQR